MSLCVACKNMIFEPTGKKEREGSLLDIFARGSCPICLLIAHLLTPLPAGLLLAQGVKMPSFLLQQYAYKIQPRPLISPDSSRLEQYASSGASGFTIQRCLPGWTAFQEVGVISPYGRKSDVERLGEFERIEVRLINQSFDADVNASGQMATKDELFAIYRSSGLLKGLPWIRLVGDSFRNLGSNARVLLGQNSDRKLDFNQLRSLLMHCDERHEVCQARRLQKRQHLYIRLLDVTQNCVVHKTTASRYFALSYVWGSVQMIHAKRENIAELQKPGALAKYECILPRTIKDAMKLVAKLRERYLWVDALCGYFL